MNTDNQIIEKLLFENLREQRSKRRWGIFFKLIFWTVVLAILYLVWPWDAVGEKMGAKKHIALIQVFNEINVESESNGYDINTALNNAADDKNTQAIILDIDSPGGSPVQASYVYNEIMYLKAKNKNLPIYAVCEDMCASAAYYIASASDKIYANPLSLVGSIGVLMDGFGFVDTMQKVGATRRLFTAGDHKAMMDPFSPLRPGDAQIIQAMLNEDHEIFIRDVMKGRGDRLKINKDTFSGLVWNGQKALPLGLIDGFGSPNDVARDVFHNDNIIDFTIYHSFLDKVSDRFSAKFTQHFLLKATHMTLS